jgi:hypothetical protein
VTRRTYELSLSVITLDESAEETTKEDRHYEQVDKFLDRIHRGDRTKQQEYRVSSAGKLALLARACLQIVGERKPDLETMQASRSGSGRV